MGCLGSPSMHYWHPPYSCIQRKIWLRAGLNQNTGMVMPLSLCDLRISLKDQPDLVFLAHLCCTRASPSVQVLIKPLLSSHLLMSHCPKQVIWAAQSRCDKAQKAMNSGGMVQCNHLPPTCVVRMTKASLCLTLLTVAPNGLVLECIQASGLIRNSFKSTRIQELLCLYQVLLENL